MPIMTLEVTVLSVFGGPDGGGNPLGVVLDGDTVPDRDRQRIAAELAYSETVFVEDRTTGRCRIFTPVTELRFAGHPTVGTSWLLRELGEPATQLRVPAGDVSAWAEGPLAWIRAKAEWAPEMTIRQYAKPADVEGLEGAGGLGTLYAWAWAGEDTIRSRFFAPAMGIAEDEATGAAAIRITSMLGQPLTIRQGSGSLLQTRIGENNTVELGGAVVRQAHRVV
jgi:predicted PhzF superfamily epimerase YddE/YHI9